MGNCPVASLRIKLEDKFKVYVTYIACECEMWSELTHDYVEWWALYCSIQLFCPYTEFFVGVIVSSRGAQGGHKNFFFLQILPKQMLVLPHAYHLVNVIIM